MDTSGTNRGLKLIELLVLVFIFTAFAGCFIPAMNASREAARRASCINKLGHQIGLAMHNHLSTYNIFPPSASASKSPDGTQTVGGWSLSVRLLSFMDYDTLYRTLPKNGDPEDTSNPATVAAFNTQLKELLCPSSPRGVALQNSAVASQSAGITNYKAMGATTRDSLVMVANRQAKPPYGTAAIHPDGMIFPGNGTRTSDCMDGLSHTIMTIETIDEAASRWTVGKEATLVGLPQASSPTAKTTQGSDFNYFAPPGYKEDRVWGDGSAVAKAGLRTFLAYDFSPKGADAGKYEDPGFSATPPAYGPSSMHPAVVICGMGDGSAWALPKQIDAANLFFLITKNGGDPFNMPQ